MKEESLSAQEEDNVNGRAIFWILVVVMLISGGLGVWAWGMWRARAGILRPQGFFERNLGAPHEVQGVEQAVFVLQGKGTALREAQEASLRQYGWADRDRGLVSIPITDAMRIVATEARPR